MKDNDIRAAEELFPSGHQPPSDYQRPAEHPNDSSCDKESRCRCATASMWWSTSIAPTRRGAFRCCSRSAFIPRSCRATTIRRTFPPQPSWSTLWLGHAEAGDTEFFVSRGYVHVIGSPRGYLKSGDGGSREWDSYDVIEWIARQPWCDGNIGMVGIGAFASEQFHAARQQPPNLKAIFPYDPRGAYGKFGGFREEYPGGVLHAFRYLMDHFSSVHTARSAPGELPPEKEEKWREAMADPDIRMYPHLHNVLIREGPAHAALFRRADRSFRRRENDRRGRAEFAKITVPTYTGAGWYGYTYKTHLAGAQSYFSKIPAPKKMVLTGPAHPDRPLRALRGEMLRWYDHWLKASTPASCRSRRSAYWVMGANEWRHGADWPLPETQWTKLYLAAGSG